MFGWPSKRDRELLRLRRELEDVKLVAEGTSRPSEEAITRAIRERRKTLSRPLGYANPTSSGRDRFNQKENNVYHGPLYDLGEIARAIDIEPYVNQSVRKHREQILKEGFSFSGEEEEMVDYVKQRLYEMELVSDITTETIVREFTTNLIAYGTSFIVKKRDLQRSSGRSIRVHGKTLKPIAALFPMDPTSVEVKVNKHGHPVRWKQTIDESSTAKNFIHFDDADVVVATIDKKPGFIFGTPYILPTLDDVRTLRRLEELAEIAINKFAFPSLHFKVGEKDDAPQVFDDGSSEIDMVKQEVENMPAEGGMVTSHRVTHEVLGTGRDVIDIHPYLEYFEARVMGGLRLSPIDLGRGEVSKSSGQVVSQSLQDSAKDFQGIIANVWTYQIILPLLLEGGFDVTPETLVRFEFSMINREEERAQQQHGQDLCNNGTITCSEFRKDYLGRGPLSEEEEQDLSPNKQFEREKEMTKLQASLKPAPTSSGGSSSSKNSAAARTVQSKVRPSNQSGRKQIKTRVTANNSYTALKQIYSENILEDTKECRGSLVDYVEKHGVGVKSSEDTHDITTKDSELRAILDGLTTFVLVNNRAMLENVVQDGVQDAMGAMDLVGSYSINKKMMDRFFKNTIEKSLKKACSAMVDGVNNNEVLAGMEAGDPVIAMLALADSLDEELAHRAYEQVDLAYRFGYVRAAKAHGYSSVIFAPVDETDADEIEISLLQKDIPYSQLLRTPSGNEYAVVLPSKK